jgi:hypothetical protein
MKEPANTSYTTQPSKSVLIQESASVYHAKAEHYLSSHQLADFRKCPLLFYQKKQGLIEGEERPAYLVGRAAHALILEGQERFDQDFAVGGPINPKTGQPFGPTTKAFAEWAQVIGKEILTEDQYELVTNMHLSVLHHEVAQMLLADAIPEGVLRTEYCGVPCQVRLDSYDTVFGVSDVKTCDDLSYFESDARRFGYVYQMAFYRAVLAEVIGIRVPVHLIAVEKHVPYRCGVWRVSNEALGLAQNANETAIAQLRDCLAKNHWPTGYEQPRTFDCVM